MISRCTAQAQQAGADAEPHTREASAGKPRRLTARQKKRYIARQLRHDVVKLFLFKLAMHYMEDGLSVYMVADLFRMSPSWLYRLRKLYIRGGYRELAPLIAETFPPALSMDLVEFLPNPMLSDERQ
jgi:hypothetical protein